MGMRTLLRTLYIVMIAGYLGLGYMSVTATLPPIYAMAGWIMAAAWVTLYVWETK